MTSLELLDIINEVRKLNGKPKLRYDNLIAKIESHPGIEAPKFLGHASCLMASGATRTEKLYNLPRRECDLLVMSESLALQAQVYDRLIKELGEKATKELEANEIKRIEHDYAENLKHHPDYELGGALKKAIRMEDSEANADLNQTLDKMDFSKAARTQGVSEDIIRRRVAAHTAATMLLGHLERGEHAQDSPVVEVVKWARATVRQEDAKKMYLAYLKERETRALTLAQIDANDRAHKHDIPQPAPVPVKRTARKR